MAKYIRLVGGTPEAYSISQLKRDNPNISFPEKPSGATLAEFNVYQMVDAVRPVHDMWSQEVVKGPIKYTGGRYTQTWEVVEKDAEHVASKARQMRNKLLEDTDHTQLPDAPKGKRAWAVYRQELRDLTKQPGFPKTIEWPTPPGGYRMDSI